MNRYKVNIISSVFFLVLAAVVWIVIPGAVESSGNFSSGHSMLDSRFFPRVLSIMLAVSSLCNLLMTVLTGSIDRRLGRQPEKLDSIRLQEEKNTLVLAAIMLGFACLMSLVGFLVSALTASAAVLIYLKIKKWQYYATAVAFSFIVYLIFTKVLYVALP